MRSTQASTSLKVCIALREGRAAASQQRVLGLMHRVSGYTLRVPFGPGSFHSLAVAVVRFVPVTLPPPVMRIWPDYMVTRQQVKRYILPLDH